MLIRSALLALLVPLLYVCLTGNLARAKGSSYIVAATVDGGTLAVPVTVPVGLPQNLDDMFELDAPRGVDGAFLPYALTLRYDFTEDGYGKRDWVGRYDGESTLYFPESMNVGPGVWAAGWYTAVDVLADVLASAARSNDGLRIAPSSGYTGTQIDVSSEVFPPGAEVTFTVAFVSRIDEEPSVYSQPLAVQPANAAGRNEVQVYLRDVRGVGVPTDPSFVRFRAVSAGPDAREAEGIFTLTVSGRRPQALPVTGSGASIGDGSVFAGAAMALLGLSLLCAGFVLHLRRDAAGVN